jgi:NitT/TauT family transport system substrate-binding protein
MIRFCLLGLIAAALVGLSCVPAGRPSAGPTVTQAEPTVSDKPTQAVATGAQTYVPNAPESFQKVSIGVAASSADSGIFIANERGYFKQEGIELDVQRFQTLVDMVPPLTSGQLQIAAGALAASVYNASERGISLRIVADKGVTRGKEWDFSALVMRKDLLDSGQVKEYRDLRGLTLATTARGNSLEVAMARALKKGGLSLEDVNYVQLAFPDMVAALKNKGIDGAIMIEPFLSRVVSDGAGVRWKGNIEIFGGGEQIAAIVYGDQFAARADIAQRWMNAYIRGVRDYNDAFGPKRKGYDEVVSVLVANTTIKDPEIFAKMTPAGLDPDGKLDVKSMHDDLGYYIESGQVKAGMDISKLIDTTFQENAVRVLGPYVP